jgi:2-phosphosulfolactate phosphatase
MMPDRFEGLMDLEMIIVGVLSFSTSVEIAVSPDAMVFPHRWNDSSAPVFAASVGAIVADARRGSAGYSLAPQSLVHLRPGTRLVLPSPDGATLPWGAGMTPTLAGCLRNDRALAAAVQRYAEHIAIIPAGERWHSDGSLRPALEDWVGAGAIISHLAGTLSPEAHAAATTFRGMQSDIAGLLQACSSGQELIARGFARDVALASALNVSACVPVFKDAAYVRLQNHAKGGVGGGWMLRVNPEHITLLDVLRAIEPQGEAFALHKNEPNPRCPVGRNIQGVLTGIYAEVQRGMDEQLAQVTLASILGAVRDRIRA